MQIPVWRKINYQGNCRAVDAEISPLGAKPFTQRQRAIYRSLQAYCFIERKLDRVAVYSASTPQVWGSINGLRKVDSAFHPRSIGSMNEYQACFGSKTLKVSLQTDHQIGTSVRVPQRPMVTCIMMGTVVPGPHGLL
ncbi:hypothetical protein TNCV_4916511 [Trichonephila clavipes]|nr:hypothetical protein TNCV_4916511 [Trichonephila clavipes]